MKLAAAWENVVQRAIIATFVAPASLLVNILSADRSALSGRNPGGTMWQVTRGDIVVVLAALCAVGCVTPVPGADQVKITKNSTDVLGCNPVGNISADAMSNLDPHIAQNLAIGLGADVVFNTGAGGVAYHCGKVTAAGK